MRDVDVRVKPQLAQAPADACHAVEQLLAHGPQRRFDRLVGVGGSDLHLLPLRADRAAHALDRRLWRAGASVPPVHRIGEHHAASADLHQPRQRRIGGDRRRPLGVLPAQPYEVGVVDLAAQP